ncbi:MAG: hypothetical protein Q8Q09_29490 [Deltaproteobacteria bacterium]|nr:hypothetical protein [Deltaproteobacteria bacterium]
MPRIASITLLMLSTIAPMQCPTRRPHELRHEESAGEALWLLAERFELEHDRPARDNTLRFLTQRYPSSRFAVRASAALEHPDQPITTNDPQAADGGGAP